MILKDYVGPWPWKNFQPKEVACKCGCGELWPGDEMPDYFRFSMNVLQDLRDFWKQPIIINSGHRCAAHNARVGGEKKSQHLKIAFDCRCPKELQGMFINAAKRCGFTGVGRYPERGFVHLDLGRKREWNG